MLSCILSQSSHRSISIILSLRHTYQWMNWPKLCLCLCESWVGMRRMGAIHSIYSYGHHPAYPTSHWLRHSKRKTSAASGTWDAQKGQPSNCSGSSWIGLAMAAPKSQPEVRLRYWHVIIHTSLSCVNCVWWPWHKHAFAKTCYNLIWVSQDPKGTNDCDSTMIPKLKPTIWFESVQPTTPARPHRNLLALAFRLPWLLFIPST